MSKLRGNYTTGHALTPHYCGMHSASLQRSAGGPLRCRVLFSQASTLLVAMGSRGCYSAAGCCEMLTSAVLNGHVAGSQALDTQLRGRCSTRSATEEDDGVHRCSAGSIVVPGGTRLVVTLCRFDDGRCPFQTRSAEVQPVPRGVSI